MSPYRVPRLDDICVSFISSNFNSYPILDSIPDQYICNVVNLIDLSKLLINKASQHVECSKLWERMACERWENCRVDLHGNSWKRLYLEQHIEELLESYYPSSPDSDINLNRLLECIKCSAAFIHSLKCEQLPSHLDLSQILPFFHNLSALDITYKILNVGMNYKEEDFGMNLTDALNISKYLQSSKCFVASLTLSECLIDDETIHILMGGLQANNTITTLDFSYNKISDVGARRLSAFLTKNDNVLMRLNLHNNQINDEGVAYIAVTLCKDKNSHLMELDLSLNNINDDGAKKLFDAVAVSSKLQKLNVSCNHISSNAFDAMIRMLTVNTSLRTLNVSGNPLVTVMNSNNGSYTGSRSMTASHSMTNSRPVSRLSHMKQQGSSGSDASSKLATYRSGGGGGESKMYAKALEGCLLNDNVSIIDINLMHTGLSKLEMKTIQKILKPRKVKQKQTQRKKILDKSK